MANQPIAQLTASNHFPIKLTSSNFPSWRKQVLSTLIGLELDHHIIGQSTTPAKNLVTGDVTKPNPEYLRWFRQDQMIISTLLGSCSDQIMPLISSAATARQAWDALNSSYANSSRSRIVSLKSRLAKNPKGSRSITEFLHDMKSISDDLALAQSPIEEEDLVVHCMNQLGDEYATFVAALKTRDTTITFPDLFDKLLDHERTLKETTPETLLTTVNQTQRQPSRSHNRPSPDNRYNRSTQPAYSPNSRNHWTSRSASHLHRTNRTQAYCQFCNIPGHETRDCRKLGRFLRENNVTAHANSSPSAPVVNVTSPQPAAMPPTWMWDTGASSNTAPNSNSVPVLSEYGGPDEIVLGNGSTHGGASHAGSERQ
ncbi:putative RNA-directed DNA polymerase [Helianthus debilis subsp. tardiflorus]